MAKIIQGKLPNKINVVFEGKIINEATFNEDGIFITEDARIIKSLSEYGYEIDKNAKEILKDAMEKGFFVHKTATEELTAENEELKKKVEELTAENEKLKEELEEAKKGND